MDSNRLFIKNVSGAPVKVKSFRLATFPATNRLYDFSEQKDEILKNQEILGLVEQGKLLVIDLRKAYTDFTFAMLQTAAWARIKPLIDDKDYGELMAAIGTIDNDISSLKIIWNKINSQFTDPDKITQAEVAIWNQISAACCLTNSILQDASISLDFNNLGYLV